jgi:hypothetical protein
MSLYRRDRNWVERMIDNLIEKDIRKYRGVCRCGYKFEDNDGSRMIGDEVVCSACQDKIEEISGEQI